MKFKIYSEIAAERGVVVNVRTGYFAVPCDGTLRITVPDDLLHGYDLFYDRKSWKTFGYTLTAHLLKEIGHEAEPEGKQAQRVSVSIGMLDDEILRIAHSNLLNYCQNGSLPLLRYDTFIFNRKHWKRISKKTMIAYVESMGGKV